jgi:hypothetical protein
MYIRRRHRLGRCALAWTAACILGFYAASPLRADEIHLKDGTVISGRFIRLPSLVEPATSSGGSDKPIPRPILLIDDDITRTFVHKRQVADVVESAPFGYLQRFFPNKVGRSRRGITSVGPALGITPFDEFGRARRKGAGTAL